jgi:transposase
MAAKRTEPTKESTPTDNIDYVVSHWLSEVEWLCVRAFVPDRIIALRIEGRILAKTCTVGDVLNPWGKALNRPLTEAEKKVLAVKYQTAINNRDLLASRIGRQTATVAWKYDKSDLYSSSNGYKRRLAEVGAELGRLGWLIEPARHPWKKSVLKSNSDEMKAKEKQAEETAKGWTKCVKINK